MEDVLTGKGFKVVFWNIRSLLRKKEGVRDKLSDLSLNIVAITESWLKPNVLDAQISIPGYNLCRLDRKITNEAGYEKRGGGLLVYLRNNVTYDTLPGDCFNVSNHEVEIVTLSIRRPHTRPLYLVVVYKPPSGNITTAVDTLKNLLQLLPKIDKSDVIIGGDFNIDFAKPRKNNIKKLSHFSTKHNIPQLIKSPSRPMDWKL